MIWYHIKRKNDFFKEERVYKHNFIFKNHFKTINISSPPPTKPYQKQQNIYSKQTYTLLVHHCLAFINVGSQYFNFHNSIWLTSRPRIYLHDIYHISFVHITAIAQYCINSQSADSHLHVLDSISLFLFWIVHLVLFYGICV